jgi:hypothetical protein
MKAIVRDAYGSADVLELRDIDRPVVGDDEVLVRVRAAGVDLVMLIYDDDLRRTAKAVRLYFREIRRMRAGVTVALPDANHREARAGACAPAPIRTPGDPA